jgi:hypothetical protein
MKPNIQQKLEGIFSYPLFQSVGKPLLASATPVNSWPAAAKSCRSYKWEACQLMARNTLFRTVQRRSWYRSQEWGPLAEELQPLILSSIDRLLCKISLQDKELKNVRDALSWDIMATCIEYEYRDLVAPIFYIPVVEPWYAAGHFPCGWDGDEFPDAWDGVISGGQLMVF